MMVIIMNKVPGTLYTIPSPIFCDCGIPIFFDDMKDYEDDDTVVCPYCKTEWFLKI